jgi:hypothetical protein
MAPDDSLAVNDSAAGRRDAPDRSAATKRPAPGQLVLGGRLVFDRLVVAIGALARKGG